MTPRIARPRLLVLMLFFALAPLAFAQPLPEEAQAHYDAALAAIQQAVAFNEAPFPDKPYWSDAIAEAELAIDVAPNHPLTMALLAEVYSRTRFHIRAWNAWNAYLEAGYVLNAMQTPMYVETGEELAWFAYNRGDLELAAQYQLTVLDAVPFAKEPRVWLARIWMEQGQPERAIPYWQAVVDQDPSDTRAAYFLGLAEDQVRWGVEAENAFRSGVSAFEVDDYPAAASHFAAATRANPLYGEAWAWRGRIAFERGIYDQAADYYGRAVELTPGNETYFYFQQESVRRAAP